MLLELDLQFTESLIAWEIINEFVADKRPIFCIHDSFIVLQNDEDKLRTAMKVAYVKHVGMEPLGIKKTIKKCYQSN